MSSAPAGRPAASSAPPDGAGARGATAAGTGARTAGGPSAGRASARSAGPASASAGSGVKADPHTTRVKGAIAAKPGARLASVAWWLPPAVAAAVMAGLSLWGLTRGSTMGNDEVATRYAATLSLPQLAHLLRHVDAVHGTYYLLMHAWVVVGTSPTVLRIPSVIAMIAGAALIAIAGRWLTGSAWAGLAAGVIMALTPTISYYAQTARSFALVLAVVVASLLALRRVLDAEAAGDSGWRLVRWWLLYAALVIVASYLNEMALLVLAANLVTVLLARRGRRALAHFLLVAVVCCGVVVPLALLSLTERGAVGWIPRPDRHQVVILWHDYFGGKDAIAAIIFALAIVAVAPPLTWLRRAIRRRDTSRGAPRRSAPGQHPPTRQDPASQAWWEMPGVSVQSAALPLVTLPAGLLMAESVVGHALYVDRYVLYGEAGAALLAGAGCYRIGRWLAEQAGRRLRFSGALRPALLVVPGVAACLCALLLNLGNQRGARTPDSRMYDFGSPSFYIGAHARPGDGLLFSSTFYRKIRYGYPADFRDLTDVAMALSPQQAGTFDGTDKPAAAVTAAMPGYQRIWVVGSPPSGYLASPGFRAESVTLTRSYRLAVQQDYKGMSVALWVRTTRH